MYKRSECTRHTQGDHPVDAIALVGIGGRFPGADDLRQFWSNVCNGVDSITHFSASELEDSFSDSIRRDQQYVRARSVLTDVDLFDAEFFGMRPREAALTDPQHRLLLECAWTALEDGGCDPGRFSGAIGVFAGCSMNTYFLNNVCAKRSTIEQFTSDYQVGSYEMLMGALSDTLATRIAYKLNLRGPAVTVQSACSTSLLAVALARQSLLSRESDLALAGGVSVTFPQKRGYVHQAGGMVSSDGVCRPFDANASGTVFGDAAAFVLLKRLEDAIADGDRIYAVIRGAAVNNDGREKVGFTAPSVNGQAEVIKAAQAAAAVDPSSIGYVECHGTATPLGDPIEFAGLLKAFGQQGHEKPFCALGSAKANIGHADAAAGAVGLIKTALALHQKQIPPLANFRAPNPRIKLNGSPFYIPESLAAWPAGTTPRRAGVSALGVGGTNVHVVLEEAPVVDHTVEVTTRTRQILPISARDPRALSEMSAALAKHIAEDKTASLTDIAFTLQTGRAEFAERIAIVCEDADDAVRKLREIDRAATTAVSNPRLVFLFPGQGAQYSGMARGLYQSEPVFREHIDCGAAILLPLIGEDLRPLMFGGAPTKRPASERINATQFVQPALFLVEYALAQLWMEWGLRPDAMIGHSVGEFVAASLSGVLTFEDALRLIAARGRLLQARPAGAMLAVRMPEAELRALLGDTLDLAAINAPSLCVASGGFEAVAELEARLSARGVPHRRLHTSHAFHSRMMLPAAVALTEEASTISFGAIGIPYVSTATGQWMTGEDAASPNYWARHCCEPVRFAQAVTTVCEDDSAIFLEVGPGSALTALAAQCLPSDRIIATVNSVADPSQSIDDDQAIARASARLWCAGLRPDWNRLHGPGRRRVSLPSYRFQRQRHWIDAPAPSRAAAAKDPVATVDRAPPSSDPPAKPDNPVLLPAEPVMRTETASRTARLRTQILDILEDLSGDQLSNSNPGATFLELGFDSLFLGQVAQQLKTKLGAEITFRQLLGEFATIDALADHLDKILPPDALPSEAPPAPVALRLPQTVGVEAALAAPLPSAAAGDIAAIMQMQLQAFQSVIDRQLRALQGAETPLVPAQPTASAPRREQVPSPEPKPREAAAAEGRKEEQNPRFRPYTPGSQGPTLTEPQRRLVVELSERARKRAAGSKAYAQSHRGVLADPRTAAGFREEWKELVFPIVCARSKGSKIWDVDDNEYVDLVNGYGQTAFGHAPDFVCQAIADQLRDGFAIGPQSPLSGEVAQMIAEMTCTERVTFCNTGSEAVMAAMRVARAATGRKRIAVFNNDYHGQFDEVLVKAGGRRGEPRAFPIASGIPVDSVANMVVLPYGTDESLQWIRDNAADLAAVIAEPVQSRHPNFRPVEFLKEIRSITEASGTVLVFDEVVTGFRVHPGGVQPLFGIRADLTTYGKVLGGGMPIGVLAGKAKLMDVLDGGQWSYGDNSRPEVAPTFFAGTFVRHPLVLAAARATLRYMQSEGPSLQETLAAKTSALVNEINSDLAARGIASRAETFSSWFHINLGAEDPLGSLFYPLARSLGLHIQEHYPCFLTTAHSEADIRLIASVFRQSLDRLQAAGILTSAGTTASPMPRDAVTVSTAPVEAPLTEPQMEIWLAAQLGDDASCSFNESLTVRIDGELDLAALSTAWDTVIARHDALRSHIAPTGDRMLASQGITLPLPVVDFRGASDPEAALQDLIDRDARTPLDLITEPLARAQLARLADRTHALVFTAHHIVCDGWSMNVVLEELATVYTAHHAGKKAELAPPLSFLQYSISQKERGDATKTAESYWLQLFSEIPTLPELPTDRPRPELRSFEGSTQTEFIDAELYRKIKKSAAQQGCTLFAMLFAGLQLLIARLSKQSDVVIAVPSAGQSLLSGDNHLVGHCVNLLPLRIPIGSDALFSDHLQRVKRGVLDAYEHQEFTFGTLVRELAIPRSPHRLPLTEIQFNLERLDDRPDFADVIAVTSQNPKSFSNFDMFFNVSESSNGLRIDCDFNTDIFDKTTIARWIGHYRTLLTAVAEQPRQRIDAVPLLSRHERAWLTSELNDTTVEFPRNALLHELITAQAQRTPRSVAASDAERSVTYAQLEALSNQLARRLLAAAPRPGGRVAVAMKRSVEMLTAFIAVGKAGHAYVPLDPEQPLARLRQIIDDAEPEAFLCDDANVAAIAPASVKVVRTDLERSEISSGDSRPVTLASDCPHPSAYVIYTSGSTGKPKGVEVSQRALVNFVLSMTKTPGFTADDTVLAVTAVSFDIAALELYVPLVVGACTVIATREEVRSGFGLVESIRRHKPTILQATPSLWRMLREAGFRPDQSLKALAGGEPLPRDLADQLLENGAELWNLYGPTETTVWSSAGRVYRDVPITIGAPIANTQLYLLDDTDQLAPIGVPAHLHIGGEGLATGYFKNSLLTTQAFREVAVDGLPARRLFRTGDLAVRRPDGNIQVLGRIDSQVKLRGFRIELEEIEAILRRAPTVANCAVAVRGAADDQRLVAYIVLQPGAALAGEKLSAHVAAHLPDYMVPASWVALDALPLTPNKKLDRKALPDPKPVSERPQRTIVAPSTPLETKLATIWSEVLKIDRIGIHENLFGLGADSLHIFRIAARMNEAELPLKARHLLHNPTIAQLAAVLETTASERAADANDGLPSLREFRGGARRTRRST